MTIPDLGTLEEVNLREAWSHEAHSFTPWLAGHLDLLGNAIGVPLELEGQEVAVDAFSADILARNARDDSLVLIENQLETTDHSHLGQIMTYLAGLDAQTIIWIAADFREAHLSAIHWLNEHTADPFAFFAVKVKVVRIADSPMAPIFEVLAKPNLWERRLQAVAEETRSLSSIGEFRKAFWGHYLNRFPEEQAYGATGGYSNRWRTVGDLVISSYVAKNDVGLFIRGRRGAKNQEVYDLLAPHEDLLAGRTGAALGQPDKSHFFGKDHAAVTADRAQWDALTDWLYEQTTLYVDALQELA